MAEKRISNNDTENNSEYFTAVRRTVLKAGYAYCILNDTKTNEDLIKLLTLGREELVNEFVKAENKEGDDDLKNLIKEARQLISGDNPQADVNYIACLKIVKNPEFLNN
ncbi:hypothetical protein [Aliarcobacter cryaerophilus]|uniref:hypothetical protein n=1 Tax=Aliarcobacter cryaerophilus TaxID=28198 RepID=UPI0021B252ED|nr:hypothetical protein [Aliarcobacter cryaerophilus]MCT7510953.1 hypothetical protein [Aliarcobacter cryaerophilus]